MHGKVSCLDAHAPRERARVVNDCDYCNHTGENGQKRKHGGRNVERCHGRDTAGEEINGLVFSFESASGVRFRICK